MTRRHKAAWMVRFDQKTAQARTSVRSIRTRRREIEMSDSMLVSPGSEQTMGRLRGAYSSPIAPSLFSVVVFLIALVPLTVTPVVPTIDFYNHVARYYVLGHLDAVPALRDNYSVAWALLPNLGLDIIALPLFGILPPLIAAKAVLILILSVQFGGVLALNAALNGRIGYVSVLLAAMLLNSYIFTWGFANFLLGSGLSLWALASWVLLRERRLWLASAVGALLAIFIFLCHGLAFALYGLVLSMLELGRWLRMNPRRVAPLAGAAIAVALQAIAPALLFLNTSTVAAGNNIGTVVASHADMPRLMDRLVVVAQDQLTAILRVANSPWLILDIVSFAAIAGLLFLAVRRGVVRVNPVAIPALLLLGLLCVVTPPSLFGVGKISDRIPLVTALLLAAALAPASRTDRRGSSVLLTGMVAIFLVRTVANTASYAPYDEDFADFLTVAQRAPAHAVIGSAIPDALRQRNSGAMRCEMYLPLLVPLRGNPVPLFANPSQQPIRLRGALAEQEGLRRENSQTGSDLDPGGAGYRYYLACGYDAVPRQDYAVLARRGRFMLLERR